MYWFHRTKQTLMQCIGFTENKHECNVLVSQNKTNINAMYWFHRTKQTLTQCIGFTGQNFRANLIKQANTYCIYLLAWLVWHTNHFSFYKKNVQINDDSAWRHVFIIVMFWTTLCEKIFDWIILSLQNLNKMMKRPMISLIYSSFEHARKIIPNVRTKNLPILRPCTMNKNLPSLCPMNVP